MGKDLEIKMFGLSASQFDKKLEFFPSKPYTLFLSYAVNQLPIDKVAYFFKTLVNKVSVPDTLEYFETKPDTVEQALNEMVNLTRKVMPRSTIRLEKGVSLASIKREKLIQNVHDETAPELYTLYYILRLLAHVSGHKEFVPSQLELISPYSPRLEQIFSEWPDCEILFEQPSTSVSFPIDWLNLPVALDVNKFSQKKDQAIAYSFVDSILFSMDAYIGQSNYNIDTIADHHGVSARTLQNQLKEHGKSYQELKDQVLLQNIQQLFLQSQLSLSDIALSLGYASITQFSRSVKRVTGMPPSAYRRHLINSLPMN